MPCLVCHVQVYCLLVEVAYTNLFILIDFLDIPDVANHLQNNYKYWKDLDEQQRSETKSPPAS